MREGWEMKKIIDVVIDFHQGLNTAGQKIKFVDKGYPIIQTRNLNNGRIDIKDKIKFMSTSDWELYRDKYKPSIGDVFLTNIGTIGKTAVVSEEEDYLIHWNIFIFKLNREEITPFYLKYFLDSPSSFNYYFSSQKGGTVNFITKRMIANMAIPMPSIQEQKQIAEILDVAFTAIEKAKANIEKNIINAKELFQSKLNAIFSQKGDGWEEKSLGELGKVSMCKRILKNQTTPDGDIPFYKIGTFGKKANAFIPKEIYDDFINKYSFPKKGDILISASGTIGRRVIYDGLPAYFQDSNIVWIDNNEVLVTNEYLYQFYGVCDWNPSKGATISRLYNSDLRRINISFPNIKEQKQIVPNMVKLSEQTLQIELNYKQKLEDLEELKKSILQKAFSGELIQKEAAV
jgi:type I restriction enzyme S subunit